MAIYFISVAFIYIYGVITNANKTQTKRKTFIIVSFGILILIAALRAPDVGLDLVGHYVKKYTDITLYDWKSLGNFSAITGYEIGYCYFTKILSVINPDVQFYIVVCAILIYGAIGYFIYKESDDVIMSTLLMIFTCTYYMCMTMIRQGIAFSIILIGYANLDHSSRNIKDYIKFALWIILASTFHDSAMLCISMIIFDRFRFTRKHIVYGMIAMVALFLYYQRIYLFVVGFLNGGENNYERYMISLTESRGNINIQSVSNFLITFFAFLLGYYVLVWNKKKVKTFRTVEENKYSLERNEGFLLYMVLIASLCRLLIFKMNIINRFTYYFIPFLFILYPHAIYSVPLRSNRIVLRRIVYLLFLSYFVWMTVNFAGILYGTVPYKFFWQNY